MLSLSDVCLEGLSHGNIEVSQLRLGGRKRRKPDDRTEGDEVGRLGRLSIQQC